MHIVLPTCLKSHCFQGVKTLTWGHPLVFIVIIRNVEGESNLLWYVPSCLVHSQGLSLPPATPYPLVPGTLPCSIVAQFTNFVITQLYPQPLEFTHSICVTSYLFLVVPLPFSSFVNWILFLFIRFILLQYAFLLEHSVIVLPKGNSSEDYLGHCT